MELRIKEILKQKGMSAAELGRRMDCNIANMLSGQYMPTVRKLEQIAEVLEVPVWELLVDCGAQLVDDKPGQAEPIVNMQTCPHCGAMLSATLSLKVINTDNKMKP